MAILNRAEFRSFELGNTHLIEGKVSGKVRSSEFWLSKEVGCEFGGRAVATLKEDYCVLCGCAAL